MLLLPFSIIHSAMAIFMQNLFLYCNANFFQQYENYIKKYRILKSCRQEHFLFALIFLTIIFYAHVHSFFYIMIINVVNALICVIFTTQYNFHRINASLTLIIYTRRYFFVHNYEQWRETAALTSDKQKKNKFSSRSKTMRHPALKSNLVSIYVWE